MEIEAEDQSTRMADLLKQNKIGLVGETPPRGRREETPEVFSHRLRNGSPRSRDRPYEAMAASNSGLGSPIARRISDNEYALSESSLVSEVVSLRSPAVESQRVQLQTFLVSNEAITSINQQSPGLDSQGSGFLSAEAIKRLHRQATNGKDNEDIETEFLTPDSISINQNSNQRKIYSHLNKIAKLQSSHSPINVRGTPRG